MKGFKAFKKGLICDPTGDNPFQFEENTVYETEGDVKICKNGFHFCEYPLDVFDYYPLIDKNGEFSEFAEVEALGEVRTEGNKICTKKIKIGAKIDIKDFVKSAFEITYTKIKTEAKLAGGDCSKLAGGYSSTLAGGDCYTLAGGDCSKLAGGDCSKLAGSDCSKLAGGYSSTLAGGNYSKLAGGNYSTLAGGDCSTLAGGNYSKLAGGDCSTLAGGDCSTLAGGDNSLIIGGNGSFAKGKKGTLIVLVERGEQGENYVIKNYKAELVDGEKIKEDTFYKLENGEFKEA